MGLTYHFALHAPASTPAKVLKDVLVGIESQARQMGFHPTMVLDASFDTSERRDFARRLTTGLRIQDERLKSTGTSRSDSIWGHDARSGSCRVIPERAIVLVVTDENGKEYCFGFFRYPTEITVGENLISISKDTSGNWIQREFIDSPDPRLRTIVAVVGPRDLAQSK